MADLESLQLFTDEDLRKEIERRKSVRREQERQARIERNKRIIPALLAVVDTHSRTSCDDENHCNAHVDGCDRCYLLEIRAYGEYDRFDITQTLSFFEVDKS